MIAPIDVAILVAFLLYSIASGLRARKVASQDLEQYFLAGRTLPGWKAGISMAATQFAADTPLLVTGMIATAGLFSLWRLWIYAIAFLLVGFVLGGPWRRASVLTDAELAELRYGTRLGTWLRAAKAIYFGTIFNCAVLAMVLLAATRIAEPFLSWDQWLPAGAFRAVVSLVEWIGAPLTLATDAVWERSASNLLSLGAVVAVTTMYSTTGGLRAVVNTDVVQFAVAMVATLIYAVVLVDRAGGLGALPERLAATYGAARAAEILTMTPSGARDAGWAVMGVIALQWLAQMNADGTGYLAQRTMACRSDGDARGAAIVFVVAQILVRSLLWIPIGLALLVLLPDDGASVAAREATFVEGIVRYLPAGARGLMLCGMLAALASTLDTHLNWGASYWTNDLYRRLYCQAWRKKEPSGRALVWVARASNLVILVISLVILTQLDSIESAWKTTLLLGAGMGVPLVLRWLWWRVSAAAELGALVASGLLAPLLLHLVSQEAVRLLLQAGASAVVTAAIAFLFREPLETRLAFYQRVRPPGFWGPVARACGDDAREPVRRLALGLTWTFGTAATVFCLLAALGAWLFGSPPPRWFPGRPAWIALLLTVPLAWAALARRLARPKR